MLTISDLAQWFGSGTAIMWEACSGVRTVVTKLEHITFPDADGVVSVKKIDKRGRTFFVLS